MTGFFISYYVVNYLNVSIYEDTKKGLKTSCSLSNIEFNSLSKKDIESIKIGFDNND